LIYNNLFKSSLNFIVMDLLSEYDRVFKNFKKFQGEQLHLSEYNNSNIREKQVKMYEATSQLILLYDLLKRDEDFKTLDFDRYKKGIVNIHKKLENILSSEMKIKNSDIVNGLKRFNFS
jgi:hypothetical protein